jgi:pimeloyl-ACP methyl ester carboxylesterase
MEHSNRAAVAGLELAYDTRGSGEHVVLVHHGAGAEWFAPLVEEPALCEHFCLVHYHRAGYASSSPLPGRLTFEQEAETFRGLMQVLGISRAHVVGHSASACIALQCALDAPDIVHSLALLEPALMAVASPPDVSRALELYRGGDLMGAVETFLRATCGPDARSVVEKVIPGALQRALADAETFFGHELPALRQWSFGPEQARRITQPVLAVLGEQSANVEPFVLPNAGHLLHLENPRPLAEGLAAFWGRRPLRVRA